MDTFSGHNYWKGEANNEGERGQPWQMLPVKTTTIGISIKKESCILEIHSPKGLLGTPVKFHINDIF